ncbi:hypothetical protein AB3M91_08540 [Solibacillus isronensis]
MWRGGILLEKFWRVLEELRGVLELWRSLLEVLLLSGEFWGESIDFHVVRWRAGILLEKFGYILEELYWILEHSPTLFE